MAAWASFAVTSRQRPRHVKTGVEHRRGKAQTSKDIRGGSLPHRDHVSERHKYLLYSRAAQQVAPGCHCQMLKMTSHYLASTFHVCVKRLLRSSPSSSIRHGQRLPTQSCTYMPCAEELKGITRSQVNLPTLCQSVPRHDCTVDPKPWRKQRTSNRKDHAANVYGAELTLDWTLMYVMSR